MSVTSADPAPRLRFETPPGWRHAGPDAVDWLGGDTSERALGVLAPSLRLDVRVDGSPVRAAASVVLVRTQTAFPEAAPAQVPRPSGDEVQTRGWVDLPVGRALRVQTWRDAPLLPDAAPGPHLTLQYVIEAPGGWLVLLTFDTSSFGWAEVLLGVFDEIAVRAGWAR